MSKLSNINMQCRSLQSLSTAAEFLQLELREQSTFRSFSEGGTCDYAIGVPGGTRTWEIGVRRQADGTYQLVWDDWGGGGGLEAYVGKNAHRLTEEYALQEFMTLARANGAVDFQRGVASDGEQYVNAIYR